MRMDSVVGGWDNGKSGSGGKGCAFGVIISM